MNKLAIVLLFLPLLFACGEDEVQREAPRCIVELIDDLDDACDEGAQIVEYEFNAKTVYYVSDGLCYPDAAAAVYDSNCNLLGILGGFGGLTDIEGVNFQENAIEVGVVWKDE